MKRIAVILSGCGVYDGAEIHEATATLLALDQAGAQAVICAPRSPQLHVIDHLTGQPAADQGRDVLAESARIARGEIQELADLDPAEVDAALLPGGFGAAKNLCTFATEGADCTVNPQVEAFLRALHEAGKPIGAICIAPVILAKVFGGVAAPQITIGNDPGTAQAIEAMGGKHVAAPVTETVVDEANKFVTTPAYMLAERVSEVFAGIEGLVRRLLALC